MTLWYIWHGPNWCDAKRLNGITGLPIPVKGDRNPLWMKQTKEQQKELLEACYVCGDFPPRYPVPAIPMHTEYTRKGEMLLFETYNGIDVLINSIGDWKSLYNW